MKAWSYGLGILFAMYSMLFFIIHYNVPDLLHLDKNSSLIIFLLYTPMYAPLISSFVVSYYMVEHKVANGITVIVPSIIAMVACNSLLEMYGHLGDFSGASGLLALITVATPWALFLCVIGAYAGYRLSK